MDFCFVAMTRGGPISYSLAAGEPRRTRERGLRGPRSCLWEEIYAEVLCSARSQERTGELPLATHDRAAVRLERRRTGAGLAETLPNRDQRFDRAMNRLDRSAWGE